MSDKKETITGIDISAGTTGTTGAAAAASHESIYDITDISGSHPLSERALPGWATSANIKRILFYTKGFKVADDATRYCEQKAKSRHSKEVEVIPPYRNPKFSPWQQALADAINAGYNIVADAVTSCGKTWAVNQIIAYEVLSRNGATALLVSPNSEVLRETVASIQEHNTKRYQYNGRMTDTISRNYATYDETHSPSAQILIVSAESLVEFFSRSINKDFISSLRFIVFDEVHLSAVTQCLWWSQYIPHQAQLIVLSATLGNPEHAIKTVTDLQRLQPGRADKIKLISYSVRPIPLQPLVFKGCNPPTGGLICKEFVRAGAIDCIVNRFDPTNRDIRSLDTERKVDLASLSREEQQRVGLELVSRNIDKINQSLEAALETALVDPTPAQLYGALSYLFSNNMAPVMLFHTTSESVQRCVNQLVAHITQIEHSDPEWREADRKMSHIEKSLYRTRDDSYARKSDEKAMGRQTKTAAPDGAYGHPDLARAATRHQEELAKGNWNKAAPESQNVIDIPGLKRVLAKWRFPLGMEPDESDLPRWIYDALEMGIGVYVNNMSTRTRYMMFDSYKEGKLKLLVTDSSISVGVNLPIRTAVMCGSVPHTLYLQASGRAGRRGLDDQGYILHFMPKEQIRQYLTTPDSTAHLQMDRSMTNTDLVRLLTPDDLSTYYVEELKRKWAINRRGQSQRDAPPPRPEFEPKYRQLSPYKRGIIEAYLESQTPEDRSDTVRQIQQIKADQLHYHRLTNFLTSLPGDSSIILLKLLISGVLHRFQTAEFIDLMSILLYRVELSSSLVQSLRLTPEEIAEQFYIPRFERFPGLFEALQRYSDQYKTGIDFTIPVHRYFTDFCFKQKVYTRYLDNIEMMGDWLYALRKQTLDVVPGTRHWKGKATCDAFAVLLNKVDETYIAARKHL